MTRENIERLENARVALYQLELVQDMAKTHTDNHYPIHEYAYLLDNFVKVIKDNLGDMTTTK
ncbi:Uncharacterised protein [Moraxella lacunata]|uniref:Uncharacterized protein n=2 Tax=Moraxellaceae TaxID=468 RepID=A0A378TSU5_MORLA|nr:Uncharacterised protein [Moraxella lacunata]